MTGGALTSQRPLKFEKKSRDHEAIFLDHYDWLLDWARQHTLGAAQEAEDLVQDLYVRFVQMKSGPVFTDDDEIRAYLYTSLKNLFISRKLRNGREAVSGLLAVDFDSAAFSLSAVDRSQLLHVRSDLAGICEYACIRRKTNRAAAALILRFFLGYLPTEVMALLRAKRSSVDTLIETARLEAKAYLNRPGVLRFLSRGERKATAFPRYLPERPDDLFAELQRRIFAETEGTCLQVEELRGRYLNPDAPAFTTQEVAHLVSCSACLSQASRALGLPDSMLRSFTGGDTPEGKNPPSAETGEDGLKKLRRKLRETYEHRPKKLQIAVDGEVRGVQTITSASSRLQIQLPPLSRPGFVEVLSEQGLGLLYLDLQWETLDVPTPRVAEVHLSDGRQLSVSWALRGGAPVIDVTYDDPLLEMDTDVLPSAEAAISDPIDPAVGGTWLSGARSSKKGNVWFSQLLSIFGGRSHWTVALAVSLYIVVLLGLVNLRTPVRREQQPEVGTLLAQSLNRTNSVIPPHGAVHSVFSLEVHSSRGTTISAAGVDVLRSADRPLQALRLREASGNILASHWVDAKGRTRDLSNQERHKSGTPAVELGTLGDTWQHTPDVADFEQLAGGSQNLRLHEVQGLYEVSFSRAIASEKSQVIEGRLVIAVATMRPIAETLRVQEGSNTREYQFRELRYEVLRPDQVHRNDFEPASDAYSVGRTAYTEGTVHLTLEALKLLSNQPQSIRAAVDLERDPNGAIEVSGVLQTRQEAQTLTRSLRSLPGGSLLGIELHSSDEPVTHRHLSTVAVSPTMSIASDLIPLDGMLREHLKSRSGISGDELDENVRQSAREILERSAWMRRAAWGTSQIGSQYFRADELSAMHAQDRKTWFALLARHLADCEAELAAIATTLTGARVDAAPPWGDTESITNLRSLALAADSLSQNADHLDRLLAAGFALSPDTSSAPVSQTDLLSQLEQVHREESRLASTVQRLQQETPNHHNEKRPN
jgi:DNA-directed RNA polymerase specialized sigma24 family protein